MQTHFLDYIEKRVEKIPEAGCWLWMGALAVGYPAATINMKKVKLHRLMWQEQHGRQIPDGMYVCHLCDIPCCVNPEHLFIGTALDNIQDCIHKGRFRRFRRISVEQRKRIREEYLAGGVTMDNLAEKYGCSKASIQVYVRGRPSRSKCA